MRRTSIALLFALGIRDCRDTQSPAADRPDPSSKAGSGAFAAEPTPRRDAGPVRIEALDPAELPPLFVMRGGPRGSAPIVFLHGMCGHGLGYAQSFQFSAAKKGLLIAPQADVKCGSGPWAKWSGDLNALHARIETGFRALGLDALEDVLVIGYSQGATRAEQLARKWPERYTRLILMGAPQATSARGLERLRGAVMMAGERDRKDLMRAGTRALTAAGIPAVFQIIPEATHGAMGPVPEKTMGEALDWLWANQRGR